ncbi:MULTISPECIES: 6-phosphogluconolactonase [unclassified Leptolyngbya]|uniref:6-phosphogluconolactonase n=1 Tax=unclassified Leptolyngbya TaxID=2650499 RepID=UPI001686AB45|nr:MULTISPECIES: 6-phosphogluconolactonase [unclassified Leptolyngbya]MBD1913933.1 6-phosphogluconolactonase [Leptolyngbya sp. FACHB-8]MBD2156574.1 6-phosphogluconolactonase [Leptolyngbya sp. FACHB-16]
MDSAKPRQVEVFPDREALVARSLELVLQSVQEAIARNGRYTIALAGGSTPKPLYEAIAQQSLPWEQIYVFWGDERYVPHDHPDSNAGMARRAWLDHVPIPAENIHPMPTDDADPAVAADRYEQELKAFLGNTSGTVPTLDMILLGMGDDGHTASLFPHTEALGVRDRLITVGNKDGQPRISFTVPLINQSDRVVFMVSGASKHPALIQVFAPEGDADQYPSRLIQPQGMLYWLLDAAAWPQA